MEFTEELFDNMEKGNQADIVVLDFAKAFDKVNHSLLVHKLCHYGVNGQVGRWIESFLRDRQQSVVVQGVCSATAAVRSGVPQGSVLGPALFLAYINDLPQQLSSQARLFADDTAVYRLSASESDQSHLQQDLLRLEKWENSWDMVFHPDKCVVLHVSRKRHVTENKYFLHGQQLTEVPATKYLGVTITSDLSWDTHISNICAKANKTLGFLRRNLKISSTHMKVTAYNAFVRPIVEYACSVWDPHTRQNISNLERIQRRAARFVVGRYHDTSSVSSMIDDLGWVSLQHRS